MIVNSKSSQRIWRKIFVIFTWYKTQIINRLWNLSTCFFTDARKSSQRHIVCVIFLTSYSYDASLASFTASSLKSQASHDHVRQIMICSSAKGHVLVKQKGCLCAAGCSVRTQLQLENTSTRQMSQVSIFTQDDKKSTLWGKPPRLGSRAELSRAPRRFPSCRTNVQIQNSGDSFILRESRCVVVQHKKLHNFRWSKSKGRHPRRPQERRPPRRVWTWTASTPGEARWHETGEVLAWRN